MQVLVERCCGLDIHKKLAVACVIAPGQGGEPTRTVRTFGTMTDEILALGDWLTDHGVTHVVMESTGVYWKPFFNLLEGSFTLLLVNAQHVKQVPGRKTDVKDAEWLADLLRHGLLRSSFVPEREQRELTRYRTSLVRARATEAARLQKTLEGANLKLASVVSEVGGVSGRRMRAALVEAAHAASRTRGTYLAAQYHRLLGRRGKKKPIVALGHTILIIAYHLLTRATEYQELGALYFDERDQQCVTRRLVHRLEALGHTVQLDRPAA